MTVMTNPIYQAAVRELEAVLSPRIVSRALKDGLRQLGRSPDTADLADLEKVLKSQVFRQLQVLMPVTQAKETIAGILERLTGSAAGEGAPPAATEAGLDAQGTRLAALQSELRPFNLYFEWPEVQKLRAQVQLVENDHHAGREAPALLQEAEAQLVLVRQKLEDQLVLQARELAELRETLEHVRQLGAPRVRRLETLLNQVQAAQDQRQLAPAELERAHRQARDLRRAMEAEGGPDSGEASGAGTREAAEAAPQVAPSAAQDEATEAATARLHLLDLDAERFELRSLESEQGSVLEYYPELLDRLAELRAELDAGRSVAGVVADMRADLSATATALREDLREELHELLRASEGLRPEVDKTELTQAVRVTLGILGSALPSHTDVEHVRRLYQLAREQEDVLDREDELRAAGLAAQASLLSRLESTLINREDDEEVREEVERLRTELGQLRVAHEQNAVAHELVSAAREAEEALERSLAERATEASERRLAQLNALRAKLERLPVTATLGDRAAALRGEVARLIEEQESAAAVAGLLIEDVKAPALQQGDSALTSLATEIEALSQELTGSLRGRLMRLAEEAAELGNHPLMEHIQKALLGLEVDRFPDLAQFQAALRNEREAQRQEQVDELKRLAQAASPFEGNAAGADLKELLAEARRSLEAGEAASTLKRAAERLAELERAADETLAGMPARLDAALAALEPVSKLNSDGVTAVRRILYHLDSQREALPRLSRGLQLQLDSALGQAERMLVELRSEYEATRLVADKVVSGGLLDDVLGILRTPAQRPAPPSTSSLDRAVLLAGYSRGDDVRGGAWLSASGAVLAGDENGLWPATAAAIGALSAAAGEVLPGATALTLQRGDEALLVVWLGNGERLALRTRAATAAALLGRVERESAAWDLVGEAEAHAADPAEDGQADPEPTA